MLKEAKTGISRDFRQKCVTYKSGSLAVQDMLNGNINYVIIDAAPASAITTAINEVQ